MKAALRPPKGGRKQRSHPVCTWHWLPQLVPARGWQWALVREPTTHCTQSRPAVDPLLYQLCIFKSILVWRRKYKVTLALMNKGGEVSAASRVCSYSTEACLGHSWEETCVPPEAGGQLASGRRGPGREPAVDPGPGEVGQRHGKDPAWPLLARGVQGDGCVLSGPGTLETVAQPPHVSVSSSVKHEQSFGITRV